MRQCCWISFSADPAIAAMDATINTYDNIAERLAAATWEIYLERAIDSFAAHLSPEARILDLGCGPGRDIAHFRQNRRKRHIVYDDVKPVLEALSRVFRLGLLSNGVPDVQREKIEGSGIGEYFVEIIISGEVGFGKPDPRIFRTMLDRLGAQPEEAAMVGNSLRSDIEGAQAVGMKTVWLNRGGRSHHDGSIVPYMEIRGLEELREAFQPAH